MKEHLFKTARLLIYMAAIGQLALSQVHIGIITKVFAPSVGFFLFLFVIAGLVTAFNSSSAASKPLIAVLGCGASLLTGVLYLNIVFKDIANATLLTFEEAQVSIFVSLLAMFLYLAGTVTMLVTRNHNG
ncbi:MAG: hypothetical protein PQJ58_19705 [Spirochaetales bacterium]|nr:hypothetical protein [Spirochaetales bacterium]